MDKNTLIKWALIAGAAYLVYRYAVAQGWLGGAPAASQLPAGQVGQTAATTPAAASTVVSTPGVATPAIQSARASLVAAIVAHGYDPAASYNGFEWAWFWRESSLWNNENFGPREMGLSDTEKVNLDTALATLDRIRGMAGLQGLMRLLPPAPAFAAAWRM